LIYLLGVPAALATVIAVSLAVTATPSGAADASLTQILGAAGPSGAGAPWAMISLGNFPANGPGADGEIVGASITDTSGFTVNPFPAVPVPVPAYGGIGLAVIVGPGLAWRLNRRRAAPAAA
jgi:hypothetical protein